MPQLPHDPRPSMLDVEVDRGIGRLAELMLNTDDDSASSMQHEWFFTARPAQRVPKKGWDVWVMMAGRGFGKTRSGAEWIKQLVGDHRHGGPKSHYRFALVGATILDARSIMVEGESGILALYAEGEENRPSWEPSLRKLTWPNGAQAFVYSAAEPDSLRGPQHHFAWCDEIAKWQDGDKAWMNLRMGLRLGRRPRVLATTTPRQCKLVTDLVHRADNNARIFISGGKMDDNKSSLPPVVREALHDEYGGTVLGRQELDGELIEDRSGTLWTRAGLTAARARHDPNAPHRRVVIGVDPSTTAGGDSCGIIVAALLDPHPDAPRQRRAVILADETIKGVNPDGWAARVAAAARDYQADLVIAESNQGGEMVRSVLFAASAALPVRLVHAKRGKVTRAEPVSILYDHARIAHARAFPELEDQLCGFTRDQGYQGPGPSPDRADALVYALTALLGEDGIGEGPRIWSL